MRTHYAQADNELHHLLIVEELGGNRLFLDRWVAQSAAFVYYWYVVLIYSWNPAAAYHLSELIEDHAYETYDKFLTEYESELKQLPVPDIARKYYEQDNPFLFDLFCTVKSSLSPQEQKQQQVQRSVRSRPFQLTSLYDVFCNIRDDENEHWKTLCNLVQFNDMNAVDANQVQSTQPLKEE